MKSYFSTKKHSVNLGTAAEVTYNTCKTPPMTSHTGGVAPPMTFGVKGQRWCSTTGQGSPWTPITTLLLTLKRLVNE